MTWFFWDAHATARLDARLDVYRARGEPTDPADFNPTAPPPPADNAAVFLDRAAAIWRDESEMLCPISPEEIAGDPRVIERHPEWARRALDANPESLALLRRAGACSGADSGVRVTSPLFATLLPWLSPARAMAKRCCTAAVLAATDGDATGCLNYIDDMLTLARSAHRRPPTIVGALVSDAIASLAASTLETTLPRLDVTDDCARDALQDLCSKLLDDRPQRDAWLSAAQFERAGLIDGTHLMVHGQGATLGVPGLSAGSATILLRPLFHLDTADSMDYFDGMAAALEQPGFEQARARLIHPADDADTPRWRRPVSSVFLPSLDRTVSRAFRGRAMRRMAAIAIACRFYQAENGRLPADLTDLVPHFVTELPADPFSPTGGTFVLETVDGRPRLRSVYVDSARAAGSRTDQFELTFLLDGPAERSPLRTEYGADVARLIEEEPNLPVAPSTRP